QAVAQARHPAADAVAGLVPAEQSAELPADGEESPNRERGAVRRVVRRDELHRPGQVTWATVAREGPDVLEPEVSRQLVDPPGPGGVIGVRNPHRTTSVATVPRGRVGRRKQR